MGIDVGQGTTISFGTSGFSANVTEIGEIGEDYEVVDTTHLNTSTGRTYILGRIAQNAEISLTTQWDPSKVPPAGDNAASGETVTITFYDGSTCAFTGVVPGYRVSGVTPDGLIMGSVRVQPSGNITWTP